MIALQLIAILMVSPDDCVRTLKLPLFGPWVPYEDSGPITTRVKISVSGTGRATFEGGLDEHRRDIRESIAASEFKPSCGGQTVVFVFEYRTEGPERDRQYVEYRFVPPRKFIIIGSRVKASFH